MTIAYTAHEEARFTSLPAIGGLIASLVPAGVMLYVLVISPILFSDSSIDITETVMGWMAPLDAGAEKSPYQQIAYPLFFFVAFAAALPTVAYRRVPYRNPGFLAVAAMLLLAGASTLWSVEPRLSLVRACVLGIITTTVILAVYGASSFKLMMKALFAVVAFAAAANLVAVIVVPAGPIGHAGVYGQKNAFGWASAVFLFFGLYNLFAGGLVQRATAAAMIVLSPVFLIVSDSETSLILAIASPLIGLALLYLARHPRISPAIAVPIGLVAMALVYFVGSAAGTWSYQGIMEALIGDPTLTGRTEVWSFAAGLFAERPWLGYGYEAVWGTGYDGIAYKNALGFARVAPTGHNGYVDIALYLGITGIVVLVAIVVAMLATAGTVARRDWRLGLLMLTLIGFVLMHNLLESDLMISSNPLSILMLLFFLTGLRLTRPEHAD